MQETKDKTYAKTRQDSKNMTTRAVQHEKNKENRTARTGYPEQDRQNRIAKKGRQEWTTRTGQGTARTGF
jgi:hypothetical protein